MRRGLWLILIGQSALVIALLAAARSGALPLGVRGEWQWGRVHADAIVSWGWLALAALATAAYAGLAALGMKALAARARTSVWSEGRWLTGLFAAAVAVQAAVPLGAPDEYDLTKWAYVNYLSGSSGYFQIARDQAAADPWRFLARYPEWIKGQDSLHIGTHPPGLIVAQCVLLRAMAGHPALAGFLCDWMPPSVRSGFRQLEGIDGRVVRPAERAALYATALLTLLMCAGTVVPLYFLARAALPAPAAWCAAALWPLVPAANLFQPAADTTYPVLATSAWALAAWSARLHRGRGRTAPVPIFLALAAGALIAFGMVFTLAFLPVGLIAGLVLASDGQVRRRQRAALAAALIGGGLAIVLIGWIATSAGPFLVWEWNLYHHARFYDEYPRTYLLWLWVNPIELAIAIGLPTIVWWAVGLAAPRSVPRSAWAALFVLVLVDLTGRNMGEVARLWMLLTPPFLVAAGGALHQHRGGPIALAATTGLVGLQTLGLQLMVQVVYPV